MVKTGTIGKYMETTCQNCKSNETKDIHDTRLGWCKKYPELGTNNLIWGKIRDSIIIKSFGCADFNAN